MSKQITMADIMSAFLESQSNIANIFNTLNKVIKEKNVYINTLEATVNNLRRDGSAKEE